MRFRKIIIKEGELATASEKSWKPDETWWIVFKNLELLKKLMRNNWKLFLKEI